MFNISSQSFLMRQVQISEKYFHSNLHIWVVMRSILVRFEILTYVQVDLCIHGIAKFIVGRKLLQSASLHILYHSGVSETCIRPHNMLAHFWQFEASICDYHNPFGLGTPSASIVDAKPPVSSKDCYFCKT